MTRAAALVNAVNLYIDNPAAAQLKTIAATGKVAGQDQATMQGFALEALRTYISPW